MSRPSTVSYTHLNGYAVYRGTVLSGDEMPKYVGDGALKVVCFSPDREKMQRIRSAAERIPGVEINSSWWDNLEIMAAGVHKGAALRCLAQRLEIPLDEVMAIGDNENDLPKMCIRDRSTMASASTIARE